MGKEQNQPPLTKEEADFLEHGFIIGGYIEQRLGVPQASLADPEDLASIGLAVYASQELQQVKLLNDMQQHTESVIAGYSPQAFAVAKTTPQEFRKRYPQLIGNGDYSQSEIAQALRAAPGTLPANELQALEEELAILMARRLKTDPSYRPVPASTRINVPGQYVTVADTQRVPLTERPTVVMEYGPGIAGASKIPSEVMQIPQSIFVESNAYTNQVLVGLAGMYGLPQAQRFIGRMDGIKSATEELIRGGASNKLDIITASMVHSATQGELQAGVRNGRQLLKPGGILIAQAPLDVASGEVSGRDLIALSRNAFGTEPTFLREFSYTNVTTGRQRDAVTAIFKK